MRSSTASEPDCTGRWTYLQIFGSSAIAAITSSVKSIGYREVVLLGQTVNSYVWDETSFAGLLRAVCLVEGIERVRFTSR
jgi:tRNA A37 methylthiotransferase MiaB